MRVQPGLALLLGVAPLRPLDSVHFALRGAAVNGRRPGRLERRVRCGEGRDLLREAALGNSRTDPTCTFTAFESGRRRRKAGCCLPARRGLRASLRRGPALRGAAPALRGPLPGRPPPAPRPRATSWAPSTLLLEPPEAEETTSGGLPSACTCSATELGPAASVRVFTPRYGRLGEPRAPI